ncbi:MAG TPA: alpha/beta hydrolase [Chromatiales bacterium]|nr:alpha/beta hydrolase [Chromatiales bacterium]HEX21809.1 alpha/beta hydrolase [Chromatiales bacterium]
MSQTSQSPMREIVVQAGETGLPAFLSLPDDAVGLVAFVHGSGSSRFSSRNQFVAGVLNAGGLGTLLFDLLTPEENAIDMVTAELRFDIPMLGQRTVATVDWLTGQPQLTNLPLGLFGASTGAAAALHAAAERPERVRAVVSRGGRPDLAMADLPRVQTPTLLIVGGRDVPVIGMNEEAARHLRAPHQLAIVEGATHLFEEPGTLEKAAGLARDWFLRYLPARAQTGD